MTGWRERAACKGMPLERFFPDKGNQTGHAVAVCAMCPVRENCYADAEAHLCFGVWGGVNWRDGIPRVHEATTLATYDAATRDAAVALYRRLRGRYPSEKGALDAVVAELGLRDRDAVRKWVAAAVAPAERQPAGDRRRTPAERANALAMLRRIRDQHPTLKAAAIVVARVHGVHYETVCNWHKQAIAAAREQQIGAAA